MSLFNEYQNKNFTFLTRYINGVLSGSGDEMTEDEMKELLVGDGKLTYDDLVEELSNSKDDVNKNALIFYTDRDGYIIPLNPIPVPVRATKAERAWLYYYIQKPEARLFLDDETIMFLKTALEKDGYNAAYPLNDNTFEIRDFNAVKELRVSMSVKYTFDIILRAIHEKKYIITDNKLANGNIITESKVVPFRFEYIRQTGALYVSVYGFDHKDGNGRCIKMNIMNLRRTKIGEKVEDYDSCYQKYIDALNKDVDNLPPLVIKVSDHFNGFDRTVYTFANYKRESYRDEDGNIIMKIHYRRFQKRELIEKLLFLGSAVTVVGPDDIKKVYVENLREVLANYT